MKSSKGTSRVVEHNGELFNEPLQDKQRNSESYSVDSINSENEKPSIWISVGDIFRNSDSCKNNIDLLNRCVKVRRGRFEVVSYESN
jgi:hypothetical protein